MDMNSILKMHSDLGADGWELMDFPKKHPKDAVGLYRKLVDRDNAGHYRYEYCWLYLSRRFGNNEVQNGKLWTGPASDSVGV